MAKIQRPKTMREMKAEKESANKSTITITNVSKQLISIHLDAPKNIDFYIGAQDIRLRPNQTFEFRKTRVRKDQIERLQKMGKIRVVSDSEVVADRIANKA